jgi:hypothetical protein
LNKKSLMNMAIITAVALTFICSIPYSEAHILIIGDSNSDLSQSYKEAKSIANLLKSNGYPVYEVYRNNATTKNILKGMYGADAIIYAGHGGYQTGNYNMNGGTATSPFALVGSNDFIWGIGDKIREGWSSKLFTAPVKPNIPVILLQSCFSTGWVESEEVSNPVQTIYNFARMFTGSGANYYATAWDGAGLELVKEFLNGTKNFAELNKNNDYEKIVKSNSYNNTTVWRNTHGYTAFVGNWLAQFPKANETTKYNDTAAEAWYNSNRANNPFKSDLVVKDVFAPATGVEGYNIYVSNTISNLAKVATSSFYVNYYLKKNASSPNIYIGQSYFSSLSALSSKHLMSKLSIPTNIKADNYNILAFADAYLTDPETNETNNMKLSSTKINIQNAYRDLVVTDVSAKLNGSKTLYVSNTIKNNGNSLTRSFCVHYYINEKGKSQRIYIGQMYFHGLGNGTSKNQNITIKLPINIVASKYSVSAYADAHKNVSESNENNNYQVGIIKNV